MKEINFTTINQQILSWLSSSDNYYQIFLILLFVILAYFLSKIICKFLPKNKNTETIKHFSKDWFLNKSKKLILPLSLLIVIFLGSKIHFLLSDNSNLINIVKNITITWFIWLIIKNFITSFLLRIVSTWMLLPTIFLKLFGLFDSVKNSLNNYGFELGKVEITSYTIFKAIFFISIIMWLGNILSNAGRRYIRRSKNLTRSTKELLVKIYDIALYAVLIMFSLNLVGIDLTTLTVFSGAVGVGLGFGLQKIASNFISGIILLTEKSININNLIEMDDGTFGYVRKLGARASILETFDGKEVMIPNEDFITSRVSNLTYSSNKGRVDIAVGVAYDTDLDLAYKLILQAANDYPFSIQNEEQKPQCYLREFGNSSIDFLLTFWLEDVTNGRWGAKSEVMFEIWRSFKKHNIEIPFPQRDLHIRSGLENFTNQKK